MDELVAANKPARQAAEMRPYSAEELKAAVLAKLTYRVGKVPEVAKPRDWFLAVAFATRDIIVDRWVESTTAVYGDGRKRVYYLSLEFLIGRLLLDAMTNLGIVEPMRAGARRARRRSRRSCAELEPDAALGNGGLGRLAACFMDSMATLGIAALRLRHPLRQRPVPPDHPRRLAAVETARRTGSRTAIPGSSSGPRCDYEIGFGGWVEMVAAATTSATRHVWHPAETVEAVAYDTPIVGWRGRHVNTLRLWSARAARSDPARRLQRRRPCRRARGHASGPRRSRKVLYPSDATPAGQELRLRQEYFFASASLQDLVRRHIKQYRRRAHARRARRRSSSTTPIPRSRSPS